MWILLNSRHSEPWRNWILTPHRSLQKIFFFAKKSQNECHSPVHNASFDTFSEKRKNYSLHNLKFLEKFILSIKILILKKIDCGVKKIFKIVKIFLVTMLAAILGFLPLLLGSILTPLLYRRRFVITSRVRRVTAMFLFVLIKFFK